MKKNVAGQKIGGQLVSATDGSAFTGAVTVYVTGDAGTQAAGSVGSGACTHEGNGYHTYAPAQAETNYDLVAFTFVGTGAIPATIQIFTAFPQTGDNFARLGAPVGASISADIAAVQADTDNLQTRIPAALVSGRMDASVGAYQTGLTPLQPTTAGRTLDVSATGEAGIDWANIGSPTTAVNLSGTNIDVDQVVASVSGAVGSVTGAVGSVTGNVGGNVTGSVGSVATGGIAAASFAAGAIDAAAIATDALGALELAAGAASEIATAVRSELTTELGRIDVAVSTRLASASYTAPLDAAGVRSAVGLASANLDTQLDALPTAAENATAVWGAGTRSLTVLDEDSTTLDLDATIRAAVGLASANLDTQIGDLPTNAELANALGTADDAVLAAIATVDTVVDAIKVTTDKLDDTLEDDAGIYRFTTNALEQAPSGSGASASDIADEVQTRTIAAVTLVNGLAANSVTAAALASDAVAEIQSGLATPGDIPTANENADALLNRDMGAVSDTNSRSPLNALRFVRNGFSISGSVLTVLKEDDTTAAYTRDLTSDPAADPITGVS